MKALLHTYACVVALCLPLAAENWPQFRGPNATGLSATDEQFPVEFGPDKNLAWGIEVPEGHSSPVVWGERIFLTGVDEARDVLLVLAIDRENASVLWQREIRVEEFEQVQVVSNAATATPATDGERVYAYFGSAGLFAFDIDGDPVWEVRLPVARMSWGSGTSPILDGDRVLLAREAGEEYLLAVSKLTGEPVWRQSLRTPGAWGSGHSTPVVWGDEIVLHRTREIAGFDRETGQRRWWLPSNTQGNSTPFAGEDLLYVTTWTNLGEPDLLREIPGFEQIREQWDSDGDGLLSEEEFPEGIPVSVRIDAGDIPGAVMAIDKSWFEGFDTNKDGRVSGAEWDEESAAYREVTEEHGLVAIRPTGEGELAPEAVLWRETRGVAEIPSPLAYRGKVYMVTNGGIVSCSDAATGELLYRARLGATGLYYSSPVASGGMVYFASGEGVITVISDADVLEVLARNDLGEAIFATPALVDGGIYVRAMGRLYAFRESE